MERMYQKVGYSLPGVMFWNVGRHQQQPVKKNQQSVALVSGRTSRLFEMLNAGGRQSVYLRLHAGYLEPGTVPGYRGIKQDRPGVTGIRPGKSCMLTEGRYKVQIISRVDKIFFPGL